MPSALTLPALHQELYLLKVLESLNVFVLKVGERLSDSRTLLRQWNKAYRWPFQVGFCLHGESSAVYF